MPSLQILGKNKNAQWIFLNPNRLLDHRHLFSSVLLATPEENDLLLVFLLTLVYHEHPLQAEPARCNFPVDVLQLIEVGFSCNT